MLKKSSSLEVGITVTTADDKIRSLFEPHAPPIKERVRALEELHSAGIRTCAMIAPMLPGAEGLIDALSGKVDHVLVDKMNYHFADWVYRKFELQTPPPLKGEEICSGFERHGVTCEVLF